VISINGVLHPQEWPTMWFVSRKILPYIHVHVCMYEHARTHI